MRTEFHHPTGVSEVVLGQPGVPRELPERSPFQVSISVHGDRQNYRVPRLRVNVVGSVNLLQEPAVLFQDFA